ncbi:MAG TPA: SdpA family antimicrobial peptide system protein [Plantibacter sp.]|uniref:SdpA family antimicrobial peptide system protein n=1 Tax=unclassified Plantibacter TaxID=2624265 RepID=UPI002CB56446|nr:SdpA family antimicrobial peptide system protein [Plantibacter sp.]
MSKPMWVTLSMAVILVAVVFLSSTPVSTHTSGALKDFTLILKEVAPQGWGFFTKDPRTPFVTAYTMTDQRTWAHVTRGPNALPSNAFGLNRESRLDEYDHSQVIGENDLDETWIDCTGGGPSECASAAIEENGVQDWAVTGYDLRLCGKVLLVRQEPMPIDYAGLEYQPRTEAIRADVECTVRHRR